MCRLLAKLTELHLAKNTIVIFLTDNGPQQVRYNSGMLERKGSVHEGGIRVPFFVRWPAQLTPGRLVDRIAAHIDLVPTLLEACRVPKPAGVNLDGVSLLPLMKGESVDWPDRTLFFQWHRGDVPQLYRAFAARSQRYKLVQPLGAQGNPLPGPPAFKLYDMGTDPLEFKDIAASHPEVVEKMGREYERWFKDVSQTRGFDPPRISLGATNENPVVLTRQDWRGPRAGWGSKGIGHWEVQVEQGGQYDLLLRFPAISQSGKARFALGELELQRNLEAGARNCAWEAVQLRPGPGKLEAAVEIDNEVIGVHYVEVKQRK
jgi:hypothetical protein